jgi:hypothetical protein
MQNCKFHYHLSINIDSIVVKYKLSLSAQETDCLRDWLLNELKIEFVVHGA